MYEFVHSIKDVTFIREDFCLGVSPSYFQPNPAKRKFLIATPKKCLDTIGLLIYDTTLRVVFHYSKE